MFSFYLNFVEDRSYQIVDFCGECLASAVIFSKFQLILLIKNVEKMCNFLIDPIFRLIYCLYSSFL